MTKEIKIRKKVNISARKLTSKANFFPELAKYCGFIDQESLKNVYYGLIKMLSYELRTKGYTRMQDWGDFSLITHGARRTFNVNDGKFIYLPSKKVIKYEADYKLKSHFSNKDTG